VLVRSNLSAKHIFETKLGKIASNAPPIRATATWIAMEIAVESATIHPSKQRNRLQNLTFDRVADGSDDNLIEVLPNGTRNVSA